MKSINRRFRDTVRRCHDSDWLYRCAMDPSPYMKRVDVLIILSVLRERGYVPKNREQGT